MKNGSSIFRLCSKEGKFKQAKANCKWFIQRKGQGRRRSLQKLRPVHLALGSRWALIDLFLKEKPSIKHADAVRKQHGRDKEHKLYCVPNLRIITKKIGSNWRAIWGTIRAHAVQLIQKWSNSRQGFRYNANTLQDFGHWYKLRWLILESQWYKILRRS